MDAVSQTKILMEHLRRGEKITAMDALRICGCWRLSARVWDMRHLHGLNVKTANIRINNKNIAQYSL